MHRHAAHDQTDTFRAERRDGAAESEMLSCGLGGEERDLDDRDVERVCGWVEGHFEAGPDAVIETAADAGGFDIVFCKDFYYVLCDWEGAGVGVGLLVIMRRKAVKTCFGQ